MVAVSLSPCPKAGVNQERKRQMSNKELKRATAWGSAIALGASLLVGLPAANAAAGDVVLAPTTGTRTGAFFTDEFSLTTSISSLVTPATTAYEIVNPDQQPLYIALIPTGSETTTRAAVDVSGTTEQVSRVILDAYDDKGKVVNISTISALGSASGTSLSVDIWDEGGTNQFGDSTDADEARGEFVFDFASWDVERLVIRNIDDVANTSRIIVQPHKATTGDDSTIVNGATGTTARRGVIEANDMALGDGDVAVTVRSWVEAEAVADYETVDALYASAAVTVTFYDPKGTSAIPRIEKFVSGSTLYANDDNAAGNNTAVGASLQFSKPVNLDQVDLSEWRYTINTATGTSLKTATTLDGTKVLRDGFARHDQGDRVFLGLATTSAISVVNASLRVDVYHEDNTSVVAQSVGYNLATSSDDYLIEATVTDVGNNTQADAADTQFTVRAGTKSLTYKAVIKSDDTTRDKVASVPVLAVVTAGAFMSTDTLTVSGFNGSLARNQVAVVEGFTNSDGEWSVTVTSSAGTAETSYTIEFFVVSGSASKADYVSTKTASPSTIAKYEATYTSAGASTLTPSTTVASGENITLTFTAKDSYGVATNVNGTKALSVGLKASSAANLDLDAAVGADGTVTFTFKNFLKAGESDVLTATLYTGTKLSATTVTTTAVALYAGTAASAINVPATLTGNITYADYITGASTTAKPGPTIFEDIELTGTVVDANGNGIPGASVVVAAKGFQFAKLNPGTTDARAVDTITVSTNAAGVFQVSMWAQLVNTTGHAVTITAGGKTATTTVKTYLPTGLDGNNLKFELVMPATVVKNTTYAVTAKLTDKWGNPVATRTTNALSIQGVGSVQINSTDNPTVKQFGKDGTTTVFLRSVKDIAGPGSVTATLTATEYSAGAAAAAATLTIAEIATNVATTVWDETKFANSISTNVEVLDSAPATGKVNVGSFNGKLVVYAAGLNGARISWKVGGNWGVGTATSNYSIFNRPTPRAGVTVSVQIYVNGVLTLTKSVLTR